MGNKAFVNKNYEEAIEIYTKAIEIDPSDPIYYSNSTFNAQSHSFI